MVIRPALTSVTCRMKGRMLTETEKEKRRGRQIRERGSEKWRGGGREGEDQSVSQSDGRTDSDRQTGQMEMESRHRKGERGGCGVWGMIEGGREEGR